MDREYEFFVTTEEPHYHEGKERGLIRRLVMKNFFESKWSSPRNDTSEHNSASTVQAKTKLKSRFRVPRADQSLAHSRTNSESAPVGRVAVGENRKGPMQRGTRRTLGFSETSSEQCDKSGASSHTTSPINPTAFGGRINLATLLASLTMRLTLDPSQRFDPFNVLPVVESVGMDRLLKLHKSGAIINSIVVTGNKKMAHLFLFDAGALHATMATWTLYEALHGSMGNLRIPMLNYKNEAIRRVNTQINIPGESFSDELIATVLTLANLENLIGAYDIGLWHIAALKRMVNARGGLQALDYDSLMKGIIWVDFHVAARFRTFPSFPFLSPDPHTLVLPDDLAQQAAETSPTSFFGLRCEPYQCFKIFHGLHQLAIAVSSEWFHKVDMTTISGILYEVEYIILSVPDHSRDFLQFDCGPTYENDDSYQERNDEADGASIVEALLAAALMFIYAVLRRVPLQTRLFSILLDRLHIALDRPNVSIIDLWTRERNLDTLLWVLVVACSVAPVEVDDRQWWIVRLAEVIARLGLPDQSKIEQSLHGIAWTDIHSNHRLGDICAEVFQHQLAAGRREICALLGATELSNCNAISLDTRAEAGESIELPIEFENGSWTVGGYYVGCSGFGEPSSNESLPITGDESGNIFDDWM